MRSKRILAALLAVVSAFSVAACGSSDSSGATTGTTQAENEARPEDYEDQVEVEDTETIKSMEDIPESERQLRWLSYFDINPTRANPETRTDLDLFQKKGGSIIYDKCSSTENYTKLANYILAQDPPDIFWFETNMTFPFNVTRGMFQPVDSIVDFDSDLWKNVKETAENYTINGKHYVAPVRYVTTSVITYDKAMIEAAQLDDPYELYLDGQWTWDTWYDMMDEFVSGATGDEVRYGVNGWFAPFIFYSTGKSIIMRNPETDEYYSNLDDADLERAANLLYDVKKNNFYYNQWIGQASDCFKENILFYAMGPWASMDSHTPKEDEEWGNVPMPKDPNTDTLYYIPDIETYMWVNGSKKDVAVKTWLECAKTVTTDEKYKEIDKEKFFTTNPQWTEDMYKVGYELLDDDTYTKIMDPGRGISTVISDDYAANNDTLEAVNSYMYTSVMKEDENGAQFTWAVLKEQYRGTIESELKTFNEEYKKYKEENP
ncbi:MAG: extracellular solute-binding protein [Ruminococcus sp.]|nr:extracellular solute-binding protein [Ruminococcus sp.]